MGADGGRRQIRPFQSASLPDVTFVSVSHESARVEVPDVMAAVRPNTCLVSVMLANNETGVIMVGEPQRGLHSRREGPSDVSPDVRDLVVSGPAGPGDLRAGSGPEPDAAEASDPPAHGRRSGSGQDPRQRPSPGGGLPHHRGTQGVEAAVRWFLA